jgi:hypothetical protein
VAAELAADRLLLSDLGAGPALPSADMGRPVVQFHDGGVAPTDPPAPRHPLHTVIHVLPGVHPHAGPLLRSCAPVVVAGLLPAQAHALTQLLELPAEWARALTALTARQVLLLGAGDPLPITVSAGRTELGV